MEVKINIGKRHLYVLSLMIVVTFSVLFVYGQGKSNPGHDADSIWVPSLGKSLDSAVKGGYFDKKLECVSGRYTEKGSGEKTEIFNSTEGKKYAFKDIFESKTIRVSGNDAPTLTCINNWIMTGCSAATSNDDAYDNDEYMDGKNKCVGDQNGVKNRVYARCCRII